MTEANVLSRVLLGIPRGQAYVELRIASMSLEIKMSDSYIAPTPDQIAHVRDLSIDGPIVMLSFGSGRTVVKQNARVTVQWQVVTCRKRVRR
ncbi:MAG: hypothetical protein CNE99_01660 [OM182 bacterium MED-G24]|uniref:Uncharacterized protein n=1 Tax=OM182 bacterium MED-G24 TaxID=1986255 RepID=A0A2A5WYX8_9GAMM|nr:MAG: hypothetical protein CNE99_01660 [OM182 bacterium MED-G24]